MKKNLQFIPNAFTEDTTSISMASTDQSVTLPDLQIDSGARENVANSRNCGNEGSSLSEPQSESDCNAESRLSPESSQSLDYGFSGQCQEHEHE